MAHVFRSSLENARRKAGRDRGCLAIPWRSGRGGVVSLARHDDLVEVALERLDHMIRKPREIYLEDWIRGLTTIEIVDADGTKQVVKLREPLMLASPGT